MSPSRISTHKIYPMEMVPLDILSQLKITNPEYIKAVKRGTSTARIPQYIDLWFEKDGEIYIPRALDVDIPIKQDLRAKGHKVDFTFKATLRPHQIPAVEDLTKAEGGILQAGCGAGKGHTLDTIIYTPEGKTTIGELKVGAKVIGSNGEAITVTGVYDRGVLDTYKVTFNDGTYLYCDGEHLFTVQHYRDRQKGNNKWVTKQVQELKDDLYYGGEGSNRSKWYIPLVKPVQFKEKPVPINAYLLGALIADGSLRREGMISFSNIEEDILRRIESFFPLSKKSDCDYYLKGGYVLKEDLKKLGLLGKKSYEKFIPDIYKYNAIGIRLALLQGLIDCDGEVNNGTCVIYSTSSEQLAKDVVEIVQSLGGIATIGQKTPTYTHNGEKRIGRTSYRVYIQLTNLLPFSSDKHKKNYRQRTKYKEPFRNIKSIEYVGKRPIRCISVDAEDRLYAAEHFIVTHNTVMALAALANVGVTTLVLVHKEFLMNQWVERIQEFLGEEAGLIRGDTWDWKGRKIVIGMLQTLYSRREQIPDELLNYFGLTISDECLTYDSVVKTDKGDLPIGKIVEEKIECNVLSYNETSKEFEYKPITNWFNQGEKEVIRLTFDNGKTLECTYDHPILTRNRGWVPAWELTEEDDIVEEIKLLKKKIIGVKPVYDIEVKDNHNFIANGVVVHNCHRVAARTWQQVVTMFPSYRRWGLTATTRRSDNLEGIFFSHIGPVIHKLKGPEVRPKVYRLNLNYKLDLKPFRQWNGDINLAKLVTGLSKISPRNEIILDTTLKAALKGRKIIVFSERRGHLENLVQLFNEMAAPHGIKGGLYIGGIKQEILDQTAEECDVLFATYQIAKEALDIPELDTCILATPVSNEITVEQSVGRITRQYEGKRDPLVIDIVDNDIEICQRMFFKRAKVYNRKEYPIVSGG